MRIKRIPIQFLLLATLFIPTFILSNAAFAQDTSPYLIGATDVLNIYVWKEPDLTQDVTVLPDGKRIPAAYFLDQVGAKGLGVGGAVVFSEHANFIINKQEATAKDILCLALELKNRVKQEFGIELEEEVIYLPAELPMP